MLHSVVLPGPASLVYVPERAGTGIVDGGVTVALAAWLVV